MKKLFKPVLLFIISHASLNLHGQVLAKEGLLDARSVNFSSKRIPLGGQWLWKDGKLIDPQDPELQNCTPVTFPKLWNDVRKGGIGQGVATYTLTILLPSDINELAIEIPQIYSSYSLWVNAVLLATNGKVGSTEESAVPQWKPQTVSFNASDTLKLVLQIANFHHNKGGCKDLIYLGSKENMLSKSNRSIFSKFAECCSLLILSFGFFLVFLRGNRKKVIIYFALLCATWSIRSAFSNEYLVIQMIPDFNWNAMVRIEYITLYLTMIWAILFISRLFANESNTVVKYILVILNAVFVVFTIFNSPLLFTKMLALYLVTSGILLAYALLVIVRAYINERAGAVFLTVSSLLGIIIFTYDIFAYEGIFRFNSILFSLAYLGMFSMLGLALLLHLGIIKKAKSTSGTLSYKDLYGDQK